jgi:Holliday junction resolvasome RuvABC endonuclease subunit
MYIGIDQSLRSPGFSVVNAEGQVLHVSNLTTGKLRSAERLAYIRDRLEVILKLHSPQLASLEGYSMESINRPFDLGEVGGIVRLTLFDHKIPFLIIPPTQLKKFVSGNGQASKELMISAVKKKWLPALENQFDQADAIGLAQISRVFHTGISSFRSELEVVKSLKEEKVPSEKVILRRKGEVDI